MRLAATARAALFATLLCCPLPACRGGSDPGQVPALRATGPTISVTVHGGCPASLGRTTDVRNDPRGLSQHLLPRNAMPSRGLVCEYTAAATARPPAEPRLAHSIPIGFAGATRLASVINRISTQPPQGEFACPNGQFGAVAVLAFDYADRTVDLWYEWSGCQTLDNGYVVAFQGANPSFYSEFQSVFDDLAPLPSR